MSDEVKNPQAALWRELRELITKIDRCLAALEGRHDEQGTHHPGLSQDMAAVKERVVRLENVLTAAGGIIVTVLTAWLVAKVVVSPVPGAQAATPPHSTPYESRRTP